MALRQFLSQQQFKPLFHLASGLVGERDRQQFRRIHTMVTDQMGNAMGQRSGFAATSTSHHQKGAGMVVHSAALRERKCQN